MNVQRLRFAAELHLDLSGALIIGDNGSDLEAGRRAGTRTVFVRTGNGENASREMAARHAQPGIGADRSTFAVRDLFVRASSFRFS